VNPKLGKSIPENKCSPAFLGSGEHLFSGIDLPSLGFTQIKKVNGEGATHITLTKE
jgi:hypothetical protein